MEVLKEYLNTVTHEYKCFGGVPKGPDWIEVPEGATTATAIGGGQHLLFWREHETRYCFNPRDTDGWFKGCDNLEEYQGYWKDAEIVWQRPTLPEALPFIDDEHTVEKVRFNSDAFSHKHSNAEPAYLSIGYYIQPKPRKRMYAVLGGDV